jgi:ribosomal protein L24
MLLQGNWVKVIAGNHMGKTGVVVKTTPKMVVLHFSTGLEDIRVYQSSVEKIVEKVELRAVVMTEVDADKEKEAATIRTIKDEVRALKDRLDQLTVLLAKLEYHAEGIPTSSNQTTNRQAQ